MDAFLSGVAVGQATSAAPSDAVDVFGRACVPRLTVHSSCQTASRSRTVGRRDLEPSRRAGSERGNQRRVRRVRLFPAAVASPNQREARKSIKRVGSKGFSDSGTRRRRLDELTHGW